MPMMLFRWPGRKSFGGEQRHEIGAGLRRILHFAQHFTVVHVQTLAGTEFAFPVEVAVDGEEGFRVGDFRDGDHVGGVDHAGLAAVEVDAC